jgi:hypothetical protein
MLINGLNPYVQIVQVGTKTYGKDMASTTISTPEEIHGTERSWHLIPMIYKIYNNAGQGDYGNGITPQKVTDEFAFLPLVPIGNSRDPLIQEALSTINNKDPKANSSVSVGAKTSTISSKYVSSSYHTIPIEVNIQNKTEE